MNKSEHDQICRDLASKGKLIEAGFVGYRFLVIPDDASFIQVMETRKAFFAGAHHMFAAIVGMLDPGEEATPNDLKRLDLIHVELDKFLQQFKSEYPGRM